MGGVVGSGTSWPCGVCRFSFTSSRLEPLHGRVLMPGLECRSSLISHPIPPLPTLSREYSGGSTLGNPGDKENDTPAASMSRRKNH